jgi:MFS family permease
VSTTTRDAEVIGLVGLAHGTSHFFHLVLPSLFPWLMRDFALSFTEVGLLTTVFFVVSGIGQALAGFAVDRVGARTVLFFGVATLAASGLVLSVAANYGMLLLAAGTAGLGNSIFHPADFTLLNRRVTAPRLGHAFSVHGLSGNIGWAAAPVLMAAVASTAGWQVAGITASAVGATMFGVLWMRRAALHDTSIHAAVSAVPGRAPASQFAFLASGALWLCFAFFFLTTASFGILQNYSPAILGTVYGVSLALATGGLTAYLVGSTAGIIAGGFLAARSEHNERAIAGALLLAAVASALLATGGAPVGALLPLMATMGFGVGLSGPSRDLLVRRAAASQFGHASFGRVYGFVYSGLDSGLALSPVLFGRLLDRGRFGAVLGAVALLQLSSLVVALLVARSARAAAAAPTAATIGGAT